MAVLALTKWTRFPERMNTMVSLWRPLMKFLPWIVSFSPSFSLSGRIEVTTGAEEVVACFANAAGMAARKRTGMARRARRERRLIASRIGLWAPLLEPRLDN